MKVVKRITSSDGVTAKYIQEAAGGILVETTHVNLPRKHIVCFSSQVGCVIGCEFCVSGTSGNFKRSLSREELVAQCANVMNVPSIVSDRKPVLFSCMGEGEPLENYTSVVEALKTMALWEPRGLVRLAISTSGVKPTLIRRLAEEVFAAPLKLQISLHGATDMSRMKIIPVVAPLHEILAAVRDYRAQCGRPVEWNYVMCAGVNDGFDEAKRLIDCLGPGAHVKFNRLNQTGRSDLKPASRERVTMFREILAHGGLTSECYETDGTDIGAACGQMSHRLRAK